MAYQRQLITIKLLKCAGERPANVPGIECQIVDSAAALQAVAHEFPSGFRDCAAKLTRRVADGCTVCLARKKLENGAGAEVIGYELAERGVFSALGRRIRVESDVIFSHWAEVLPAYRGRRIHGALFATRDAFFRARGAAMVCGVCRPHNHASLRALQRDGAYIAGAVERVALAALFELWRTPDATIEAAIAAARQRNSELAARVG